MSDTRAQRPAIIEAGRGIYNRLRNSARYRVNKQDLDFTPDARRELYDQLRLAVRRMVEQENMGDEDLRQARESLTRITDLLAEDYGDGPITEREVQAAHKKLWCNIWPFCPSKNGS